MQTCSKFNGTGHNIRTCTNRENLAHEDNRDVVIPYAQQSNVIDPSTSV